MSHSTQDGRIQRQGLTNQCHIPHRMEEYRERGVYQSMSHSTQDGRIQRQGFTNQCHIPHRMEEYRDKGLPINVTFHTGWKNTETRAYQSMSHSTQDGRIQRQGLTNQCHIPHRMEEYRDKGLPINVTFHTGWKNTETRAYQSMSHSTQDGRIQRQGFTNQCHIPHRMEEYRDKGLPINVTFHTGWKNTETRAYQSMSHSTPQDGRIQRQGLTNQCHIPHRMEEYRDKGLPINVTFHTTGWKNTETRAYQSMSHSTQDGRIQRQGLTNQCHIPHRMEEYRDRGLPINVTFHTGWKNTETRVYQSMSHSTQDGRIQRQGLTNQCHIPHRMEEYRDKGLPINVTFHTGWKNTETRAYQSMSHSTQDGRIQRQGFTNQCHIPHRMEEYRDRGLPINVTFHTGWKNTETRAYQSMSHSTQDGRIQRERGLPINVTFHTGWKNTETGVYQSMSHSTQDGRIQRQGFTNQCHIPHRMEEYRDKGLPINVTFHTGWKNTETRVYQSMSHSTQDGRIQRQGLTNQCHIPHRMEEYRDKGLPINVTFHTGWKNTETRAYQSMSHSTQDGRIQRQGFTNQCHIPHRMEEYRDRGLPINVTFHTGWKNTETGAYQSMSHSTQDGRIQRQGFTNQCHIPHRMEEYRDNGLPINVTFHTGWKNIETGVYQSMSHSTQDGRIQRERGVYQSMSHSTQDGRIQRQGFTNQSHIPHRMEEYRDKGLPINVTFHTFHGFTTGWKNTETGVYQSMSHSTQDGRIQRQGLTNQCHIPHRMEEYRDRGLPINVTFHTGWKNTETGVYQSMSHSTQDGRIQRQGLTNQCHIPHRMEEYRDRGLPINVTFHTGWKNTETRAYQSMSHSTQDGRIQRQGLTNQCHIPHRMEEYRDKGLPINVTFHTG